MGRSKGVSGSPLARLVVGFTTYDPVIFLMPGRRGDPLGEESRREDPAQRSSCNAAARKASRRAVTVVISKSVRPWA